MLINIKCSNGSTVPVEAELSCTVVEFKQLIATKVDVPAANQRLIYSGKVLKDPETLASYSVVEGHTIHMVRGAAPAAPAPAAATAPAAPAAMPATTPAAVPAAPAHSAFDRLIAGLWLGEATPDPTLADLVPANPIVWSLTLMPPRGGGAPTCFGGGFFDDSGDVPGSPVLLFTLSGAYSGATGVVKITKKYNNRAVPDDLTVEYDGVLSKEADGAYSIKGSWTNAMEQTVGTFACRLEGSEAERPPPTLPARAT